MKRLMVGTQPWYIPNQEQLLLKLTATAVRNYRKAWLDASFGLTGERLLAVEVGAHVGLETEQLAGSFREVLAFEPAVENLACLARNFRGRSQIRCLGVALGESPAACELISLQDEDTRQRYTDLSGGGCELTTLDQALMAEATLRRVNYLKVSVCGFELPVLRGGRQLLQQSRPVVVVARDAKLQWRYGSDPQELGAYLGGLGYHRHESDGEEDVWLPK